MNYTGEQILNRLYKLNLSKYIPSDYWIAGVRSSKDAPDEFDDEFYLFKGKILIKKTSGTTNPGLSILKGGFKDYNNVGAAVVKADTFYEKLWSFGYHKGRIKALKQVNPIMFYRDGDLDSKSEELGTPITRSDTGINFHPATFKLLFGLIRKKVGGWSAGCQVCNNDTDFNFIIETVKNQKYISYCLLKEF